SPVGSIEDGDIRECRYSDIIDGSVLRSRTNGSDTSSTEAFVSEVSPETAIISVGENSQYSHPNQSVLDRFAKHDVDLYATSAYGHVKIKTDGDTYDVETTKESKIIAGDKTKKAKEEKDAVDKTETGGIHSNKSSLCRHQ